MTDAAPITQIGTTVVIQGAALPVLYRSLPRPDPATAP